MTKIAMSTKFAVARAVLNGDYATAVDLLKGCNFGVGDLCDDSRDLLWLVVRFMRGDNDSKIGRTLLTRLTTKETKKWVNG